MPLFCCTGCGCVENTACSNYWVNVSDNKPVLCSECDPETSKWHGLFKKRKADGLMVDQDGFLHGSDEKLPDRIKVIGVIPPSKER